MLAMELSCILVRVGLVSSGVYNGTGEGYETNLMAIWKFCEVLDAFMVLWFFFCLLTKEKVWVMVVGSTTLVLLIRIFFSG